MVASRKLNVAQSALSQVSKGVSPDAALANATKDLQVNSVQAAVDGNSAILAMLAGIKASQDAATAAMAAELEKLRSAQNAPRVRTVKVDADGHTVVSNGKRGKPQNALLDDCRDEEGKVRKIGMRSYSHEASGIRTGTFIFGSRGAVPKGSEVISKSAACPYTDQQIQMIEAAAGLLPEAFGLRFKLVKVTDSTVKIVPARLLTEKQAAEIQPLLSRVGLDADAWTVLRTTVDGTAAGELNSQEDDGDDEI